MTTENIILYKILSDSDWQQCKAYGYLLPQPNDTKFIHLALQDQIERIVAKYWAEEPEVLIAKIDSSMITGELVYEANPGGTQKYYHLYDGLIPIDAILEIYNY